jgi:LPXTG-motif cell wall-anchored protein
MKNVVLAIAAVLMLIALPAAAQYDTTTPTQTTTDTSTQPVTTTETPSTSLTNTQQPAEERTNPTSPMHSNDPGLTAQGTVVSWNDDEVVLRTSTGLTHFKLMPNTVGSRTFTEGQALAIDFQRNEQGVLLAKQIRSADLTPTTETTTGAVAAGEAVESAAENVGEAVEEGVEETLSTDVDNDGAVGTRGGEATLDTTSTTTTSTDTNLPATGSNAPLAGLLGLLALGGAAALRRL